MSSLERCTVNLHLVLILLLFIWWIRSYYEFNPDVVVPIIHGCWRACMDNKIISWSISPRQQCILSIFSHASVALHPHTIFGSYVFVCQTITSFYSKSEHVCRVCVFLVTALNKLLTVKQYWCMKCWGRTGFMSTRYYISFICSIFHLVKQSFNPVNVLISNR